MPKRNAKPFFVLHVLTNLQDATKSVKSPKSNKTRLNQLQAAMQKNTKLDKDKVTKAIKSLIKDGILIPDPKNTDMLRVAQENEIQTFNQDLYCFECFLPGELIKCRNCTRAFHANCTRRYADRPNYMMPPSNEIAEYKDEEELNVSTRSYSSQETVSGTQQKIKRCRVVVERLTISPNSVEDVEEVIDFENKPDVICIGEIRPPTRQRNLTESSLNSSVKYDLDAQQTNSEQIIIEKEYCTCCRLMQEGQIYQPPNLEPEEICHLLQHSFEIHKTWMKYDILKLFENMKLKQTTILLLNQFLFPNRPMMTLETIGEKLQYNQYEKLSELLCDALEFQYALGVLFGIDSFDFDCSKYLIRELNYDVKEIRRCPDCFRHSCDRVTPFWFALPCVQRHELVYAKCRGFSYWPAKVVRVLKNADKYDVRFFGGNHERSVVDKNVVRPIDSNDFPIPKSILFKKAMNELKCYQALQSYSLEKFSFHSKNVEEINGIIKTVMSAIDVNIKIDNQTNIKKRRKTLNLGDISNLTNFSHFNFEENSSSNLEPQSLNGTPTPRKNNKRAKRSNEQQQMSSTTTNSPAFDVATMMMNEKYLALEKQYEDIKRQLEMERENSLRILEQERENCQRQIELHKHELIIAKRKSYCFKCLEPAKFLCCINASYCSKFCQRAHWNEGHDMQCTHH